MIDGRGDERPRRATEVRAPAALCVMLASVPAIVESVMVPVPMPEVVRAVLLKVSAAVFRVMPPVELLTIDSPLPKVLLPESVKAPPPTALVSVVVPETPVMLPAMAAPPFQPILVIGDGRDAGDRAVERDVVVVVAGDRQRGAIGHGRVDREPPVEAWRINPEELAVVSTPSLTVNQLLAPV